MDLKNFTNRFSVAFVITSTSVAASWVAPKDNPPANSDLFLSTFTTANLQSQAFRESGLRVSYVSPPWFTTGSRMAQMVEGETGRYLIITDLSLNTVTVTALPSTLLNAELVALTDEGEAIYFDGESLHFGKDVIPIPNPPATLRDPRPYHQAKVDIVRSTIMVNPAQSCFAYSSGDFDFYEEAPTAENRNVVYVGHAWDTPPEHLELPLYYWRTKVTAIAPDCSLALHLYDGRTGEWANAIWRNSQLNEIEIRSIYRTRMFVAHFFEENTYLFQEVRSRDMVGLMAETPALFLSRNGSISSVRPEGIYLGMGTVYPAPPGPLIFVNGEVNPVPQEEIWPPAGPHFPVIMRLSLHKQASPDHAGKGRG